MRTLDLRRAALAAVLLSFALNGVAGTIDQTPRIKRRARFADAGQAAGVRTASGLAVAGAVVSVTDPAGDARLYALFDAPGTHVTIAGNTITTTVPTWIINGATSLTWDVVSYDFNGNPLKTTASTTWSGGTSSVTATPNATLPAHSDPISATIQSVDAGHVSFSVTARGPIAGTDALFEFELNGNTFLDMYVYEGSAGQMQIFSGPGFTKIGPMPYEDITQATGENRNGILHMVLTLAGAVPMTPPPIEDELRYIWWFQNSQNRLAVRFDRSGKWVLETRLNLGSFFPQTTPSHGTFTISGNTITVDVPTSDLDFHEFSWNATTVVDVLDGPDMFYAGIVDSAPDKGQFTAPPLAITSFIANPTTIRPGQQATLSWTTRGAASVTIDNGVGLQPVSGSATVSPANDTTYTLTATGSTTGSQTASVKVSVLSAPILNATMLPAPMLQTAGSAGGVTSYAITNSGGAAAAVTLTQSDSFFTQSPASFNLAPGATQVITITGVAQPAGSYDGSSTASGGGASVVVPVTLLSAAPPTGPVTATPGSNRVDVAASSESNPTGSVSFTNNGTATLNGILGSDVPWIIPEKGVVTIAPGQTVTLTFTIDRSKRPDAATLFGSAEGSLTLSFLTGGGTSFAKRTFDGTSVVPSVSLVRVIDTVQPAITTAGIPALAAGEVALVIPGVGHVSGTKGKLFVSDVNLLNPQGSQAINDVKLYYTPTSGQVSASQAKSTAFPSVPGQVSVAVADVVKNVFSGTNEVGSLHIRSQSADKLAVAATVLTANNTAGTFGNSIPVFRSDRAVDTGGTIVLNGVRKDANAHTNLYIQEMAGASANVRIDYLSASGSTLATENKTVDAFKVLQMFDTVPPNTAAVLITNMSTAGGRIAAYATPVDEASSDTWAVSDWSQTLGYAPNEAVIIPVAGSVRGANNTFYRTDASITNRSSASAIVNLQYVARDGSTVNRQVTIGAKQTDVISDLVGSVFNVTGDSVGFVRVLPVVGSFAVSSRTFTTVGNNAGTFGAGVPVVAAASAMTAGSTRPIAGLSDANRTTVVKGIPGTFRTNFAMMETTGKAATVRVSFRFNFPAGAKAQGVGSASRDYTLNGRQFQMLNSIAGEILGPVRLQYGDLTNVEADFQVVSGEGAVLLFTSSVDNATGDSILRTE